MEYLAILEEIVLDISTIQPSDEIALCLSGGGLRATFFHLGVVKRLRDEGHLSRIKAIYAVSGGSITAAHLLVHWDKYNGSDEDFEAAFDNLISIGKQDIRGRVLRRWILSGLWFGDSRVRFLAKEYEHFFGDWNFDEIYKRDTISPIPEIYFMSTSFTTGEFCSLSSRGFSYLRSGKIETLSAPLITIHLAVAASSAFPPMFPPVRLTRNMLGANLSEFQFDAVYLTDGGVYDNLGITNFLYNTNEEELKKTVLIVSDAGGEFSWNTTNRYSFLVSRAIRTTDILMRNAAQSIIQDAKTNPHTRIIHISIGDVSAHSPFIPQIQKAVRAIRTDLDIFSDDEITLITTQGEYNSSSAAPKKNYARQIESSKFFKVASAAAKRRIRPINIEDWTSFPIFMGAFVIASILPFLLYDTYNANQLAQSASIDNSEIQEKYKNAAREALELSKKEPLRPTPFAREQYKVWLQFAGYSRDTVVGLAKEINSLGWQVPGADRGGERTSKAAGLNEIRYGASGDAAAAENLANDYQKATGGPKLRVVQVNIIPPNSLEMWISE